jgi:hypothetical protein
MKESDIRNMSLNERLRTMEILWNTLSSEDEIIESPNWHDEVLLNRKTKIDNGQANFITIGQLKQYYREKH